NSNSIIPGWVSPMANTWASALNLALSLNNKLPIDDYTGTPDVANIYSLASIITDHFRTSRSKIAKEKKTMIINNLTDFCNKQNIKYKFLTNMANSLDNVVSVLFFGFQANMIQQLLSDENICIGTGSACAGQMNSKGSHVIRALGYSSDASFNLIRISWDPNIPEDFSPQLTEKLTQILDKMRTFIKIPNVIYGSSSQKYIFEPIKSKEQVINSLVPTHNNIPIKFLRQIKLSISESYLKGDNRESFIMCLINDIKYRFPESQWEIINKMTHLKVRFFPDVEDDQVKETIKKFQCIPGISFIEPIYSVFSDVDDPYVSLVNGIGELYRRSSAGEKKKICIRTGISEKKKFMGHNRHELNVLLGQHLVDNYNAGVDLKHPDIQFNVRIDDSEIDISTENYGGIDGLPLKSGGRAAVIVTFENYQLALLASLQISTRGVNITCYHEQNCPITKFSQLLSTINPYAIYSEVAQLEIKDVPEDIILFETNTDDLVQYLASLKNKDKYVTAIVSHLPEEQVKTDLIRFLGKNDFDFPPSSCVPSPPKTKLGIISMLSGGIDSPVASSIMYHHCNKTNKSFKLIHFTTNINKITTVKNIRNKLNPAIELFIVDFMKLQDEITKICPENYRTILYKVFMVLITNEIAALNELACVVMGNSWGQVASQTCENLYATEKFSKLALYNPLLGKPKTEITTIAKKIDTYNESICTGTNDCCIMYLPKHPIIKAKPEIISKYIEKFHDFLKYVTITKI
ncbi:MAG: tRNA 4-thiouridine(8) synthase, partial [Harvfovirus sp.]